MIRVGKLEDCEIGEIFEICVEWICFFVIKKMYSFDRGMPRGIYIALSGECPEVPCIQKTFAMKARGVR